MASIFRQFLLHSNYVSCAVFVYMINFTLRQETLQQTAISICIRRRASEVYRRLALQEKQLDDSSRLNVVEIAYVPDMLPSLFPS